MPPSTPRRTRTAAPSVTKDRRLRAEAGVLRRFWRWLQGMLRRPIGIVGHSRQRRLGFVERRTQTADALSVAGLCAELRQRLLTLSPERADVHFSHLVQLHDELRRKGWAGAAALPASVLARALVQADELRREAPGPAMKQLIDKLRSLLPPPAPSAAAASQGANARADELHEARRPPGASLEVSEVTHEDFEASKRSWFGDLPPEPEPPQAQK